MNREQIEAAAREKVNELGKNDIYMRSKYGDEVVNLLVDFAEYALSQSTPLTEREKEMLAVLKRCRDEVIVDDLYNEVESLIYKIEING